VIGSVDTSEFLVATAASIGFLIGLGTQGFLLPTVAALLVGGLIAAPLAAWLIKVVPPQLLGGAVGGIIVLTNTRTLLRAFDAEAALGPVFYSLGALAWVVALAYGIRAWKRTRPSRSASPEGNALAAPSVADVPHSSVQALPRRSAVLAED
jgi:hypothetical protein